MKMKSKNQNNKDNSVACVVINTSPKSENPTALFKSTSPFSYINARLLLSLFSSSSFLIFILLSGLLCCHGDLIVSDVNYDIVSCWGNFSVGEGLSIVYPYDIDSNFVITPELVNGAIVMLDLYSQEYVEQLFNYSAIGVIICEAPSCVLGFQWEASLRYTLDLSKVIIPVATVSYEDYFTLAFISQLNRTNCSIDGLGENVWVIVEDAFLIVTQVVFAILYSICIIYALYLLFEFWKSDSLKINIATCCIVLEIIGSVIRIAWLFHNPLTFKYEPSDAIVVTLHLPCSLICGMLMIFFWQDTISKSSKIYRFLSKKFFFGAIIISIFIIICEVCVDLSYALNPAGQQNNQVWFIVIDSYSSLFAVLAIFYLYTCAKALLQIKGFGFFEKSNKIFIKLTIKVLLSGFGMVISAFQLIINATPITPALFIAWLWCAYLGPFVQTLPELLLYGTPSKEASKKTELESGGSESGSTNTSGPKTVET